MWHGLEAELSDQLSQRDIAQMGQLGQEFQTPGVGFFNLIGKFFQLTPIFRTDAFGAALFDQLVKPLLCGEGNSLVDSHQQFSFAFGQSSSLLSRFKREGPGNELFEFGLWHLEHGVE
jgi:hypothetical protein